MRKKTGIASGALGLIGLASLSHKANAFAECQTVSVYASSVDWELCFEYEEVDSCIPENSEINIEYMMSATPTAILPYPNHPIHMPVELTVSDSGTPLLSPFTPEIQQFNNFNGVLGLSGPDVADPIQSTVSSSFTFTTPEVDSVTAIVNTSLDLHALYYSSSSSVHHISFEEWSNTNWDETLNITVGHVNEAPVVESMETNVLNPEVMPGETTSVELIAVISDPEGNAVIPTFMISSDDSHSDPILSTTLPEVVVSPSGTTVTHLFENVEPGQYYWAVNVEEADVDLYCEGYSAESDPAFEITTSSPTILGVGDQASLSNTGNSNLFIVVLLSGLISSIIIWRTIKLSLSK